VDGLQARLDNKQMVIEYFIGKSELIVFKIENNHFEILELPINYNLSEKIEQFRKGIYGYYLETNDRNEQVSYKV
jgi:hypothetical protein